MLASTVTAELERSAWRDGRFRAFASGNAFNNIGESMYGLAIPLLAYDLTGSLTTMALLASLYPLVITIGGPLLGVAVDRFGSRYFVLPGLILQLVSVLVLVLVLVAGAVDVWMLVVSEVLVQTGAVAYRAGWMAGIPSMFPGNAARARGALLTVYQGSVVVGPALAAVLIGPLGTAGLLWLNLATFIGPIVVWFMGINPSPVQRRGDARRWNIVGDLVDGWRVLRGSRQAFALIMVNVPFDFIMSNGTVALILYHLRDDLNLSPGAAGAIIAAANVGAFFGALAASERPTRQIGVFVTTGLLICGICFLILPLDSPIMIVALVLVLLFVINSMVEVATSMVIYTVIPEETIGRTTGFARLVGGLAGFLSPVMIASLDPWISSGGAFVLLAVAALIPGILLIVTRAKILRPEVKSQNLAARGQD